MSDKKEYNVDHIIKEHFRRKKLLSPEYNPYTGEGSPIDRFRVDITDTGFIMLPVSMKDEDIVISIIENGGVVSAAKAEDIEQEVFDKAFFNLRIRHDYEFWCVTCVQIEDAETNEKIPLLLNLPQRKSLKDREDMRLAGKPVRQIEVKHRQYGSSTEKNAYIFWVQNVVTGGVNSYICSLDKSSAGEILRRYELIADNYPSSVGKYELKSYKGQQNTQRVIGSDSIVNIGSAEKPNAPSGRTVQCVLISEAGKMKSTAAKGANKLITNMVSMVRLAPNTFILIESTAEQSGEWFRKQVFKAQRGESGFQLTFISWVTDPRCQIPLEEKELEKFISNMREYDWEVLWEAGATLDQINWYQIKEKEYDEPWEMKQENPTTVEEAFEGAGDKIFAPAHINVIRKSITDPLYTGRLISGTGHTTGPESLKELKFKRDVRGNFQIWTLPGDPEPEEGKYITNRYALFVDIGGTTEKADYSIVSVCDRYWQLFGGGPERAAMWRGHCDVDELAWIAAQIAKWYDDGLLTVEVNSLYSRGNNTEGVHYLQIFEELADHYRNIFTRVDSTDVKEKSNKFGYFMNAASKQQLIDSFKKALRTGMWVERSAIVSAEAGYFVRDEDGKPNAMEGEHDDALIGAMGCNWLAQDYMPPPKIIERVDPEIIRTRKTRATEAMI